MTADLRAEILAALEVGVSTGVVVIERLEAAGFEIVAARRRAGADAT